MEDDKAMGFEAYMNPPVAHDGHAYIAQKPTGLWVTCPECGKAQFRIDADTKISNLTYQCKNTKCKYNMIVMV